MVKSAPVICKRAKINECHDFEKGVNIEYDFVVIICLSLNRCWKKKILLTFFIILILLLNALFSVYLELYNNTMAERNSLWLHRKNCNRNLIVDNCTMKGGNGAANLSEEDIHSNNYNPVRGAGEWGRPVQMSPREIVRAKDLYNLHYYNVLVGDKISINRTLPDMRSSRCRQMDYNVESLPTASVIIVFHNEAWSTLMRTVMSVITRTPERLLKEIILVDDASDRRYLGKELDEAVSTLEKVRVVRGKEHAGLVNSRLAGARQAAGVVLLFLDAHCEVTTGWIEPLLHRASRDDVYICPVVDIIDSESFNYIRYTNRYRGAFSWSLQFIWTALSEDIVKQIKKDSAIPYPTPAMVGGLFAVKKNLFWRLGGYDEGMRVWGAENLELSWRAWQCGARVEISLCSRVGHIYREDSPYMFPGHTTTLCTNLARAALVWMDEWADFFLKFIPFPVASRNLPNVTDRSLVRRNLNCKSFKWYLENVWGDHFFPTKERWFGRIRNEKGTCLSSIKKSEDGGPAWGLYCGNKVHIDRLVIYTPEGRVITDKGLCLEQGNGQAVWRPCTYNNNKQIWLQKGPRLKSSRTGTCLTLVVKNVEDSGVGDAITDRRCIEEDTGQIWHFESVAWR